MYSRSITTPSSNFQHINPFAEQSPFLLFYNGSDERRSYHVNGLGCVTPDLFQATRYEIDAYLNEQDEPHYDLASPKYVRIPVCAYRPSPEADYEFYTGNHRIPLDSTCGTSAIHQATCGAKRLARPAFRPGGPFGAVVQTAKHISGEPLHVAYFGIDLLFYTQGNAKIPDYLEGFTRIGINHFTSIPRYW